MQPLFFNQSDPISGGNDIIGMDFKPDGNIIRGQPVIVYQLA
jgi:hypothetical protein